MRLRTVEFFVLIQLLNVVCRALVRFSDLQSPLIVNLPLACITTALKVKYQKF